MLRAAPLPARFCFRRPRDATPLTSSPAAPAKTYRYYWEDFPAGQVREFGAMLVTREASLAFAREFDPQPFHLDDDAARASLFGGLSASGWHTCAMAMRMMCDAYLLDAASLGSPGMEQIKWLRPVFPGDTLSVRMTVTEARTLASRPGVGLIRAEWLVHNQHAEPVLAMQGFGMFRLRPLHPA